MKEYILKTMITAALSGLALLSPSVAQADMASCKRHDERAYSKSHRQVVKAMGKKAAGRDIRFKGVMFAKHRFEPTCHDLRRATQQLDRLLKPTPYLTNTHVSPRQPPAGVRSLAHQPAPGLASCIVFHESRYDPQANNGSHFGIAQWTIEAWLRHGGGRFSYSPLGATYEQQLLVLSEGLTRFGCQDWCPFDPC